MQFRLNFTRSAWIITLILAACNGVNNSKTADPSLDTVNVKAADIQIPVNPLKECYFGDLHLHTALSADANFIGAQLFPEDSYKYGMGGEVTYMGEKVKRIAPLDFLAVTDHAEYLGSIALIKDPSGPYAGTPLYKKYNSTDQKEIAQSLRNLSLNVSRINLIRN
jgi:hypothetical protein